MKTIQVFYFNDEQKVILYTVTAKEEDIKRVVDNLSPNQYFEYVEEK